MHKHAFVAPSRSKWPLVLAGVLVAFVLAGWFWMSRGSGGQDVLAQGELMGDSRPGASDAGSPSPSAAASEAVPGESGAPLDPAPDTSTGGMAVPEDADASAEAPGEDQLTVESLLAQADEAYDAGDLFVALPLYKEAAVRIQVQINTTPYDSRREELETELRNLRELVRECEAQIRASQPAVDMANRTPHPAPQAGVIPELQIKELGNFPYDDEKGGVPPDVAALDGTQIRLTGYMLPAFQTDQIKTFTLVADVYECCFGQPPVWST
jgi:hypothetical protein